MSTPTILINLIRGDSASTEIQLTLAGQDYTPPGGTSLLFSMKRNKSDPDNRALVQKISGAGVTVAGTKATVSFVHEDTRDVEARTYVFDVQANEISATRTVAQGSLVVSGDVTRQRDTSVPIFTTEPTAFQSAEESAEAAEAARVAAVAAKNAADADAEATAADRVQTGLDRTATGQDRVQTGLDRTAVVADKDTVAADKATVAADKATVITNTATAVTAAATATAQAGIATTQAGLADAARIAAQAARTQANDYAIAASESASDAGVSKEAAEAAQAAAESARDAALAAQAAAEAARVASESARDAALAAQAASEAARDDAVLARDAALAAQAAAEAAAAAAGASEAAAAASAAAASASEIAAALSESNAATSEANAATSESNAANSAGNAATSESNANSYANDAYYYAQNAGSSESNAYTYSQDSLTSANNASSSEANSYTYSQNSLTYSTNSAASAAAALVSQTAAGASQVAAALSEANSLTYANTASTAATTALNAQALQFKGGVAGASVPATLPLAGDYYMVTSAGTSQSKTWAVGDKAIYNGVSGSWTQISGFFASVTTYDAQFAQRQGSDVLYSDGSTSSRGQFQTPGTRGSLAGAASVTWRGVVTLGSSNVTSTTFIAIASAGGGDQAFNIRIALNGGGAQLDIAQRGAFNVDTRAKRHTTFQTLYAGTTGILEVAITAGTGNPVVLWNNVDISAAFVDNNQGTPPDWLASSLVTTVFVTGSSAPVGPAPLGCWILGTLTTAERTAWAVTGKPPAWVAFGGHRSMILSTARNSDFSALATDFTAGPNCTVSAASGALVMTSNGSSGSQFAGLAASFLLDRMRTGAKYRVRGTITANTTGGTISILDPNGGDGNVLGTSGAFSITLATATEAWVVTGGFLFASSVQPASVVSFTIDDLIIERLGALSLPRVQCIPVLDDVTMLGGNAARLVGMTGITEDKFWRISADTSTSGNQQLLGGSILDSTVDVIDTIEQTTTATITTLIGSSSGNNGYKTSSSITSGINPTTLVTRKLASNNIWINANSATAIRTTITGHRTN